MWPISHRIFSRIIHILTCVRISFLFKADNIPLYVYTTYYVPIHLSVDISVFILWLQRIMLLWTLVHKYLLKSLLSVFLDICPEVEFLSHVAILHLFYFIFRNLFMVHRSFSVIAFSLLIFCWRLFHHIRKWYRSVVSCVVRECSFLFNILNVKYFQYFRRIWE